MYSGKMLHTISALEIKDSKHRDNATSWLSQSKDSGVGDDIPPGWQSKIIFLYRKI